MKEETDLKSYYVIEMGDDKARDLIAEAQKKLKGGWFSGPKYEEAAELLTKAANVYKMAKKWQEAGEAFMQAADCEMKNQNKHEAASHFVAAANCFRKVTPKEACDVLQKAVDIFADIGRFTIAAKHEKEIAEICETGLVDLERAIQAYEQAADWYQGEESKSAASNCLLKVALFAAQLGQYDKAIKIYESTASASVDVALLRYSVKDHFFKAGLCHLCLGDTVATNRALDRYQEIDPTFSSTRECQFLKNITAAFEEGDVEAFTNHVVEFDNLLKLDNWKTTILLRIKKSIRDEPSLT